MQRRVDVWTVAAILGLLLVITSCNSGSGGGGTTYSSSYSSSMLAGTWEYKATPNDLGDAPFDGQMVIDTDGRLMMFTNSQCAEQTANCTFTVYDDGFVKGRQYGWCNDPTKYLKFAMNFDGPDHVFGIVDIHVSGGVWTRYLITMSKAGGSA